MKLSKIKTNIFVICILLFIASCKIPPSTKQFNAHMRLAESAREPSEKIRHYENALSVWRKGMPLSSKANAYCGIAIGYRKKGDADTALRMANIAIKIYDKSPIFYNERALIYHDLKLYDFALQDIDKALTIDPNFTPAFYSRGMIYYEQKKYEKALTDLTQVTDVEPEFFPAYRIRAKIYIAMGEDKKAIADLTKVIKKTKGSADAYLERGTAYGNTDDYKRAISDLNKAINLDPKKAEAYLYRGIFYLVQGKYSFATANFDYMLKLNPDYVIAYLYRGFAILEMGNIKVAKENFEEIRKRDIADAPACLGMALASYYEGKSNDAIFFYDKASSLNPDFELAVNELISKKQYFYLRNHGKALGYIKKLHKKTMP